MGRDLGLKRRTALGKGKSARGEGRGWQAAGEVHLTRRKDTSPETLMDPESGDAGLGIMEVLVGSKHALENLESWSSDWVKGRKRSFVNLEESRKHSCALSQERGDWHVLCCGILLLFFKD